MNKNILKNIALTIMALVVIIVIAVILYNKIFNNKEETKEVLNTNNSLENEQREDRTNQSYEENRSDNSIDDNDTYFGIDYTNFKNNVAKAEHNGTEISLGYNAELEYAGLILNPQVDNEKTYIAMIIPDKGIINYADTDITGNYTLLDELEPGKVYFRTDRDWNLIDSAYVNADNPGVLWNMDIDVDDPNSSDIVRIILIDVETFNIEHYMKFNISPDENGGYSIGEIEFIEAKEQDENIRFIIDKHNSTKNIRGNHNNYFSDTSNIFYNGIARSLEGADAVKLNDISNNDLPMKTIMVNCDNAILTIYLDNSGNKILAYEYEEKEYIIEAVLNKLGINIEDYYSIKKAEEATTEEEAFSIDDLLELNDKLYENGYDPFEEESTYTGTDLIDPKTLD